MENLVFWPIGCCCHPGQGDGDHQCSLWNFNSLL